MRRRSSFQRRDSLHWSWFAFIGMVLFSLTLLIGMLAYELVTH